jgi:CRP/FNR family transcriptional regulator
MGSHLTLATVRLNDRCALHGCSICSNLDETLRQELGRQSHVRTFAAGETVIGEAEDTIFVGFVISGVLRIQKTLFDGRQQIVGLLLPSDMFGRVFSGRSDVAIEAACEAKLCYFSRPAFEMLMLKYPQLEHRILLSQLAQLDNARNWMVLLGCQTVMERVTTFLLILRDARRDELAADETTRPDVITIPVGRRDLAAYLGTTVESISRTVQELSRKGVLRIIDSRNFEILDGRRLSHLSGRTDLGPDSEAGEQTFRRDRVA